MSTNLNDGQFFILALIVIIILFIVGKCYLRCGNFKIEGGKCNNNSSHRRGEENPEFIQTNKIYCLQTSGGSDEIYMKEDGTYSLASSNNCTGVNAKVQFNNGGASYLTNDGVYTMMDQNGYFIPVGVFSNLLTTTSSPVSPNIKVEFSGSTYLSTYQPFKIRISNIEGMNTLQRIYGLNHIYSLDFPYQEDITWRLIPYE